MTMKRFDCLKAIAPEVPGALVITIGGGASTEWTHLRPSEGNLRVRTLGLVQSVALGLALALPERQVLAVDGDGALLMNLCGLPTLAREKPANLAYMVFDNGMYEASGLLKTATGVCADLVAVARGAGLDEAVWAASVEDFERRVVDAVRQRRFAFVGARVESGPDYVKKFKALPRFDVSEVESVYRLMRYIEKTEGITVVPLPGPRH
jgi:thiamine pyrophosphate-dependent acetolactate synthase large subunit-like protein